MGHSQNGVHGGADFVAHIGQKIAFCPRGGFRLISSFDEFRFHLLEMDDIGNHGKGTGFDPVFVVKRCCMEKTGRSGSVGPADRDLVDTVFALCPALELFLHDRGVFII